MKKYLLAVDQGTTSCRCIIFDKNCDVVAIAQQEFAQIYPQIGYVEHDANLIVKTQIRVIRSAIKKAGILPQEICSMGITNQRETVVVFDRHTGEPVHNAIVWQCRRTAPFCHELKERGLEQRIYDKTGLYLDPYFSAAKIKWILDNVPQARKRAMDGDLVFGTIDTFLLWHLTGGKAFATDYTNASRTMLFNIHDMCWDNELLQLFDIPASMLPDVCLSAHHYGQTLPQLFGTAIDICSMVGDQQAALFGQLCTQAGQAKNTYGTGCFMLMHTGQTATKSTRGLLTTLAASHKDARNYALEGSVFIGGAVVQWLRDELKLIKTSAQSQQIAQSVPDSNGIYVVPAFVGLGAPYWDSNARGIICGLTRGINNKHIVRACLESIAYQSRDVLYAMQHDSGVTLSSLKVDGGASNNEFLMQFQADIAGINVAVPEMKEITALGAAYLSGLASGFYQNFDELAPQKTTTYTPKMQQDVRQRLVEGWLGAVLLTRVK